MHQKQNDIFSKWSRVERVHSLKNQSVHESIKGVGEMSGVQKGVWVSSHKASMLAQDTESIGWGCAADSNRVTLSLSPPLAFSSLALALFLSLSISASVQPIPTNLVAEDGTLGKNRKRVNPVVHTEPPELDPISDAYRYCNLPNHTEHTREGEI